MWRALWPADLEQAELNLNRLCSLVIYTLFRHIPDVYGVHLTLSVTWICFTLLQASQNILQDYLKDSVLQGHHTNMRMEIWHGLNWTIERILLRRRHQTDLSASCGPMSLCTCLTSPTVCFQELGDGLCTCQADLLSLCLFTASWTHHGRKNSEEHQSECRICWWMRRELALYRRKVVPVKVLSHSLLYIENTCSVLQVGATDKWET